MELVGFTLDSSNVESGARKIGSALDDVGKRIDAMLAKANQINKQLGDALRAPTGGGGSVQLFTLEASAKKLQAAFDQAAASAQKMGAAVSSGTSSAARSTNELNQSLRSWNELSRGLGGLFSGNFRVATQSLANFVRSFSQLGSAKGQIQSAGDSFSYFLAATGKANIGLTTAENTITKFKATLAAAANGNEKFAQSFAKVGINAVAGLKNPAQAFEQFLKGFGNLSIGDKISTAIGLFGQKAGDALPAVRALSVGADDLTVRMAGLGGAAGAAASPIGILVVGLIAAATAVTTVIIGLFELTKKTAQAGARIFDLSDKTGISVRNLNLFRQAAAEAGKGIEIVERSFDQFTSRLEKASQTKGQTANTFKSLGVDPKNGLKNVDQSLETVIKNLNKLENSAVRGAKAQEIFGLRNEAIIPILTRVGASLDDYEKRAGGLNRITEEQAKAAKSFDISLNVLGGTFAGLGLQIGIALLPAFQALIDLLQTVIKITGQGLVVVLGWAKDAITSFATGVDFLNAILRSAPTYVDVFRAALADAGSILGRLTEIVIDTGKTIAAFLSGNYGGAIAGGSVLVDRIKGITDGVNKTKTAAGVAIGTTANEFNKLQSERARIGIAGRNQTLSDVSGRASEAKAIRAAELALAKSYADQAIKLAENQRKRELEALKELYAEGKIETVQYYQARLEIAKASIGAEIDLLKLEQSQIEQQFRSAKGAEKIRLEQKLNEVLTDQVIKIRALTDAIRQNTREFTTDLAKQLQSLALPADENVQLIPNSAIEQLEKLPEIFRKVRQERDALFGRSNVDFLGNPATEEQVAGGKTFSRTSIIDSALKAENARIQAQINAGVLTELEGRQALIVAQGRVRDALIDSLRAEQKLASQAGDLAKAFDIEAQIQDLQNFGKELTNTQRLLKGLADTKTIGDRFEELGANIKNTLTDAFQAGFEEGPKGFFDSLLSGFKRTLSQLASELISSQFLKLFRNLLGGGSPAPQFGFAGAGGAQQGGFNPLALLTGGGSGGGFGIPGVAGASAGGGSGFGQFATGGFAGGNPAQAILGGGGQVGGGILGQIFNSGGQSGGGSLLSKIPLIGKLFGGGASGNPGGIGIFTQGEGGGVIGGSGASGAGAGLGSSLAGLGAGGLLAGGGLLGSLAGGNSQFGRLLGGVGGTLLGGALGASGLLGGGIAGALPALFSNPITAIIGGALIGGALLFKFFGDREFNKFRKEVEKEYQLKVDSKQPGRGLYKSVKEFGESEFGKGKFGKKILDTIRLQKAQEMLAAYGESTGQENNPLVKKFRDLKDLTSTDDPRNRFVKRYAGGATNPYQSYQWNEHRPEVFASSTSGYIFPSVRDFSQELASAMSGRSGAPSEHVGGAWTHEFRLALQRMTIAATRFEQATARIEGMPPETVLVMGARRHPDAITAAVATSFDRRTPASDKIRDGVNSR